MDKSSAVLPFSCEGPLSQFQCSSNTSTWHEDPKNEWKMKMSNDNYIVFELQVML